MKRVIQIIGAGLICGSVFAADFVSGPKVGAALPKLTVEAVTGPDEGKKLDYTTTRKDQPTIYVFIQAAEWGRPTARYLRALDQEAGKLKALVVAVWLTAEPDKTKDYLPKAQQSLKFESTALTFFRGEKDGPEDWGLSDRAFVTTVISTKGKVVSTFGYQSLNETDVPLVKEALVKALK